MSSKPIPHPVAATQTQTPVAQRHPVLRRQPQTAPPSTRLEPQEPYKPEPLFDTDRAGRILQKSEETLKKWRQRKQGPAYIRYPDGTIRYQLSTLLKFMDECTVDPLKVN